MAIFLGNKEKFYFFFLILLSHLMELTSGRGGDEVVRCDLWHASIPSVLCHALVEELKFC